MIAWFRRWWRPSLTKTEAWKWFSQQPVIRVRQ